MEPTIGNKNRYRVPLEICNIVPHVSVLSKLVSFSAAQRWRLTSLPRVLSQRASVTSYPPREPAFQSVLQRWPTFAVGGHLCCHKEKHLLGRKVCGPQSVASVRRRSFPKCVIARKLSPLVAICTTRPGYNASEQLKCLATSLEFLQSRRRLPWWAEAKPTCSSQLIVHLPDWSIRWSFAQRPEEYGGRTSLFT